jgi:hypothetical protein
VPPVRAQEGRFAKATLRAERTRMLTLRTLRNASLTSPFDAFSLLNFVLSM